MSGKNIIVLSVFFVLAIFSYGFIVSLDEDHPYGKFSIDSFFLTPNDLSKISSFCENKPSFRYSSADGPKPAISSLSCNMEEVKIIKYLIDNGFNYYSIDTYKKEKVEVEISREENKSVKITFLEYL